MNIKKLAKDIIKKAHEIPVKNYKLKTKIRGRHQNVFVDFTYDSSEGAGGFVIEEVRDANGNKILEEPNLTALNKTDTNNLYEDLSADYTGYMGDMAEYTFGPER